MKLLFLLFKFKKESCIILMFLFGIHTSAISQKKNYEPEFDRISTIARYEPRPSVIVAHGCDGLKNNPSYKRWAEYLDSIGYNAILYDSYRAMGFPEGVCKVDGQWWNQHKEIRPKEADHIAKWIQQQKWHKGKIGLIGFSAGGSLALYYSMNSGEKVENNISALIAFYPSCDKFTIGMPIFNKGWFLKTPTQVHLAMKDDWTPALDCYSLKNAAEIIKYPNATHAFDNDEGIGSADRKYLGHIMRYDKDAHELSKIKVKEFFDKTLTD